MTTFGSDFWQQATRDDLLDFSSWCDSLSDRCWQYGESGLWCWFSSICMIEAERRQQADAEPLCWELPSFLYASPSRIASAALDARAILALCKTDSQRRMVDKLLFELLCLLRTATTSTEQTTEQAVKAEK